MTRILRRSDVERLIDPDAALALLEHGFASVGEGHPGPVPQRVRTDLPQPGSSATVLLPGLLPGVPAYTVKVNAKFPGGSPALRGVVCLHDSHTGELLALLDSASVTAWRTGLTAALGTHRLARPDADVVAVVGAGVQARMALRGLARLRRIAALRVHDTDLARAAALAQTWPGIPVEVCASAPEALDGAGIGILATWSREPLLHTADVADGTQLTSLGADEPGKQELSAGLLRRARVVVDDVRLALGMGAVGNAGLGPEAVAATLGEVLRGDRPGRERPGQLTVFAPVGLPWQDLALAWSVHRAARRDPHTGVALDLLD